MRVGGAGGPERYEGFCVDMLRELAALLKFRFHIKLVEDGLYGAPEPNGSWTGMVGELINREPNGSWTGMVGELINREPNGSWTGMVGELINRGEVRLLDRHGGRAHQPGKNPIRKSHKEPNGSWTGMVGELINREPNGSWTGMVGELINRGRKPGYFSFLDPFSPAVWLFMLLAYLAVSCVLFLAA
ncbi:glutamate receptor ionotropic, kainate 4-like, partial [Passer montanus]|uniref:glutamate receptor ionotropic, kainate 4-like n=1 Tax=Passer montanus TaxID=9160 RepID=UPI0019614A89